MVFIGIFLCTTYSAFCTELPLLYKRSSPGLPQLWSRSLLLEKQITNMWHSISAIICTYSLGGQPYCLGSPIIEQTWLQFVLEYINTIESEKYCVIKIYT